MAGGKQSNGHHAAAVGGSGGGASAAGDGSDGGFHYEWMGPPGAAVILLTLPVVVYFLYFACTSAVCLSLQPSSPDFLRVDDPLRDGLLPLLRSLVSVRAVLLYMGWLLLHFALYLVVPGSVVRGCPLDAQGHCLLYPLNGLACAAVSSAVALLLVLTGIIPVSTSAAASLTRAAARHCRPHCGEGSVLPLSAALTAAPLPSPAACCASVDGGVR